MTQKYFKNFGCEHLLLPFAQKERRELTTFEDEAKTIYYIFKMTDIFIKNPLVEYTGEKLNLIQINFENAE